MIHRSRRAFRDSAFSFPANAAGPEGRTLNGLAFRTAPGHSPAVITIPRGDFAAYIFDCDGTLGDTMPLHYSAWRAALKDQPWDFPEAFFYELGGVPTERIVEILNERHGSAMPVVETARLKEELYLKGIEDIRPIEPVVAIVNEVHGKLPMAVASGGHRRIVTRTLSCLGILDKFDTIVCAEDYRNGKPHPDPFLTAAERLGVVAEKCLVFEDTNAGIQAARAAGMQWVLVPTPPRGAAEKVSQ
jgi:beta-phosphoglucomutase family hydrolase